MKLTLIKDGETEYNRQNRLTGKLNILLTDEGRRQIKKLKDKIKEEKYDICFSSPLVRTVETAMILVGDKTEIRIDDRLIDRDYGKLEGHEREEYNIKKYWDYNLNSGDNNVEKIQDIFQRVDRFLNYLKENYSDKSILIVTHHCIIKAIHNILKNNNLDSIEDVKIDNCYPKVIEI